MADSISVTLGSGNIFEDLGFANPEEELLKAKLAREIRAIIKRRRLTMDAAATLLRTTTSDLVALTSGRAADLTIERLVKCLDSLNYTVDVQVRHKVPGISAA